MSTPFPSAAVASDPLVHLETVTVGVSFSQTCRALYVGTSGTNMVVLMADGNQATITNPYVGYHPIRCSQVVSVSGGVAGLLAGW
jgi:hypothetical protein